MAVELAERSWVAFNMWCVVVSYMLLFCVCALQKGPNVFWRNKCSLAKYFLHTIMCWGNNMLIKQNQHDHGLRKQQEEQEKKMYLGQRWGGNSTHVFATKKMQSAGKVRCGRGMASGCWAPKCQEWAWAEASWSVLSCLLKRGITMFQFNAQEWMAHPRSEEAQSRVPSLVIVPQVTETILKSRMLRNDNFFWV